MERTHSDEGRRWLDTAEEDLDFARFSAEGGFFHQACFCAQQAAEKAVKAVHYARGARSVLGHSVRGLIKRLGTGASGMAEVLDEAGELDLFYVPTRYPNGLEEGTPAEAFSKSQAARAITAAAKVIRAAKRAALSTDPSSQE